MGVCFPCFNENLRQLGPVEGEQQYFEAQEWASYCAPWFNPCNPMNQPTGGDDGR